MTIPAWIIEELRKKEEEERAKEDSRPVLQLPKRIEEDDKPTDPRDEDIRGYIEIAL